MVSIKMVDVYKKNEAYIDLSSTFEIHHRFQSSSAFESFKIFNNF